MVKALKTKIIEKAGKQVVELFVVDVELAKVLEEVNVVEEVTLS